MFDFETSKLSEEKIKEIATNTNQSFLKIAIKANGHKWSQKYWSEIVVWLNYRLRSTLHLKRF